jgi:CheY-like chemotaxis protein
MSNTTKILVVDDEPIGRQLLEAILIPEGYNIFFGADGEEALKVALSELPDIILLDVMMPKMDGFEVCKKLRQQEPTAHIPIFLITALDDRDSRIRGIDMGADDYISKPFDRIEILAKIKNKTSQITIRSRGGQVNHQDIKYKNEVHFNEALFIGLIEIINKDISNDESINFFRSKNSVESQHSIVHARSHHGKYICLLSNNLPVKDAAVANSIFRQFIIHASNSKEYQPHKLLAYCNSNLSRLIDESGLKALKAAEFSVVIIYIQDSTKDICICGQNYTIFNCQQPSVSAKDALNQYHSFTVQVNQDLKFGLPGNIVLLSKNILDLTNPTDIIAYLNACQTDTSGITFIDRLKEFFIKIDDFLVAQLKY